MFSHSDHIDTGGLSLDVNRPLRPDWNHRQREEIPWYCTSPTEAVPKTWNTCRCLVVPKNVHMPAVINHHGGVNLPCPQFKPLPESESLAWELKKSASLIPRERLNFHTRAPWDVKHITRNINFITSLTNTSASSRPPPSICSLFWGAWGMNGSPTDKSVHFLSRSDKLRHVGRSVRMHKQV